MLDKVRALPEVEAAAGEVSPQEANVADIIGSRRQEPSPRRASAAATTPPPRGFSPFKLKTGKAPHGPGEVAIDAGTAEKKHYEVGDSVVVLDARQEAHLPASAARVSFGGVDSLGFASIAAWDVKTAQTLLDREGRYDAISVAAKDGTSSAQLVKRDQAARRPPTSRSRTPGRRPRTTPRTSTTA